MEEGGVSFFPSCCIKTWLRSWQLYPKTYGGKQVIDACRIAGNGCQLSMEGTRYEVLKSNFHHYHPMNHPSLAARHLTRSSHIFPPLQSFPYTPLFIIKMHSYTNRCYPLM